MDDPTGDISLRPSLGGVLTILFYAVVASAFTVVSSYWNDEDLLVVWVIAGVLIGSVGLFALLYSSNARVRLTDDEVIRTNLLGIRSVVPRISIDRVLAVDSLRDETVVIGLDDTGRALFRLSSKHWSMDDLEQLSFAFAEKRVHLPGELTENDVIRTHPLALGFRFRRRIAWNILLFSVAIVVVICLAIVGSDFSP